MRAGIFIAGLCALAVLETGAYYMTQGADIDYYKGRAFFETANYRTAISFFEKTLSLEPDHPKAMRDLASCYKWTKNYAKAIPIYQGLIDRYPNDMKTKEDLGDVYAWSGEYKKAAILYREAMAGTGELKVWFKLAEVYFWDKDYPLAKKITEGMLKKHPNWREARLLMAKILHYSGDADGAIKYYQDLLEDKKRK
ncbi:MAG TPA: tetratricopeptide repeat protein [Candidatus Omnitrophota bacterium]|nr:tetratricopeptide repeat protein [Candidatus Omnitrophota bacterium]HPS20544.1 tetratricopeptide repeat protein [Candidatus Omnitrophota bacterium]